MFNFIINTLIWTLAIYGLFEIIKEIIYIHTYNNRSENGIYMIIATKNQENKIEGFLRSFIFKIFYSKTEGINNIIITDLGSKDKTLHIEEKIMKDIDGITVMKWKECKKILDGLESDTEQ